MFDLSKVDPKHPRAFSVTEGEYKMAKKSQNKHVQLITRFLIFFLFTKVQNNVLC